AQHNQSKSPGVSAARWQAAAVSRLERPVDRTAKQYRLLRKRDLVFLRGSQGSNLCDGGGAEFLSVVYGTRDGSLRWRTGSELIRHAGCSGTVGGTWNRARSDHSLALHQQRG